MVVVRVVVMKTAASGRGGGTGQSEGGCGQGAGHDDDESDVLPYCVLVLHCCAFLCWCPPEPVVPV